MSTTATASVHPIEIIKQNANKTVQKITMGTSEFKAYTKTDKEEYKASHYIEFQKTLEKNCRERYKNDFDPSGHNAQTHGSDPDMKTTLDLFFDDKNRSVMGITLFKANQKKEWYKLLYVDAGGSLQIVPDIRRVKYSEFANDPRIAYAIAACLKHDMENIFLAGEYIHYNMLEQARILCAIFQITKEQRSNMFNYINSTPEKGSLKPPAFIPKYQWKQIIRGNNTSPEIINAIDRAMTMCLHYLKNNEIGKITKTEHADLKKYRSEMAIKLNTDYALTTVPENTGGSKRKGQTEEDKLKAEKMRQKLLTAKNVQTEVNNAIPVASQQQPNLN